MVEHFHSESDRGAAIIAGSFTEHALGTYLHYRVAEKSLAEKLFGPVGPLSSFSQRIAVAYAFRQISRRQYDDFEAIRQARNHFAHHPLNASFDSPEVQKHIARTSMFNDKDAMQYHQPEGRKCRITYLLTCGILCGQLLDTIERESKARGTAPGQAKGEA